MAFADGRRYEALITLGARQDAAIVVEDSDEVAPKASVRLSIDPGLSPDRVTWHNHFKGTASAPAWSVVDTKVAEHMIMTTNAVRLLGAQTVIAGISPVVAKTIVQLGISLPALATRGRLQDAIGVALGLVGKQLAERPA